VTGSVVHHFRQYKVFLFVFYQTFPWTAVNYRQSIRQKHNITLHRRVLTLLFAWTYHVFGRRAAEFSRHVVAVRRSPTTIVLNIIESTAADFFRLRYTVRSYASVTRPPAKHCRRCHRGLRPGCLRARR